MFPATSVIGKETDISFWVVTGICAALFAFIIFFMVYFLFRYSRKRNPVAKDIEGNTLLELSFLAGSVALVIFMFFWGWNGYKAIKGEAPPDSIVIKATGQMWLWTFEYPGGKESGTLTIPYKRPVKIVLTSRDVIHSFYIPAFRVKQDVVPGADKTLWFIPDEIGTYDLFCTEYCGAGHSGMLAKSVVVSEKDYEAWLRDEKEAKAAPAAGPEGEKAAPDGKALYQSKGCSACHSIDGSRLIGPSFKGLYGKKERVVTGAQEREVVVDDEYIKKSELEPGADVVAGFSPIMPSQKGVLKDAEIKALIEFIKTLK